MILAQSQAPVLCRCRICGDGYQQSPATATSAQKSNTSTIDVFLLNEQKVNGICTGFSKKVDLASFFEDRCCPNCNQKSAKHFAGPFRDFIHKLRRSILVERTNHFVYANLEKIYPLAVVKHILSLYLAANSCEPLELWQPIKHFVINSGSSAASTIGFPDIYLYYNASGKGRISSFCGTVNVRTNEPGIIGGEISWPPLGIIFSFSSAAKLPNMPNIINWTGFDYDQGINTAMKLPILSVETFYPFEYGPATKVKQDVYRRGTAYVYHKPDYLS